MLYYYPHSTFGVVNSFDCPSFSSIFEDSFRCYHEWKLIVMKTKSSDRLGKFINLCKVLRALPEG